MLEIDEVAEAVGLSVPQTRRRIDALDELLDGHLKRGANNRLLLDSSALEIIRRVEDQRKSGKSIQDSVEVIRAEMESSTEEEEAVKDPETDGNQAENTKLETLKAENNQLKERVKDSKEHLRHLKDEIEYLRDENRRLLPEQTTSNEKKEGRDKRSTWSYLRELLSV